MTDQIQPALSKEEWDDAPNGIDGGYDDDLYSLCSPGLTVAKLPSIIARANHLLPDSSPYKITREMVEDIRSHTNSLEGRYDRTKDGGHYEAWQRWQRYVDVLSSLLPPE